jgi:hypothetical protein
MEGGRSTLMIEAGVRKGQQKRPPLLYASRNVTP